MSTSAIYVCRHGHTKLNSNDSSKDFIRGWVDVPLNEQGKKEAKELVAYIKTLHPAHIYSSDLSRAADIARDAGKVCKCPLTVSKDYRPWGLGSFQGKPAKDVVPQLQKYIDNPDKPVPGGGESFNQFKNRVLGAMRKIMAQYQKDEENLVVVTHFRDIKLIQSWLAKGGAEDIDAKVFAVNDVKPAEGLVLRRTRGRWTAIKEPMARPRVGVKQDLGPPKSPTP